MKTILNFFLITTSFCFCAQVLGHDVPVHQRITVNAEASAFANSSAYADFINTISSDFPRQAPLPQSSSVTNSMVTGSAREDDPVGRFPTDVGGYRSLNHFYDPLDTTYGKGLSDFPPDIRSLQGTNSFAWASISNSTGIGSSYYPNFSSDSHPINTWSWQNARYLEWLGLTETNQSDRQSNLDNMFTAIGHVMHLLEDTSQPQHVRNEQHLDKIPFTPISTIWRSPIEDWGNANVANLNYGDGSMLDWRDAGFTKLEDFWDRHLYAPGSATALNNAENGGAQLGLAEWCNANFLGARHLYPEYYQTNDIRYYPYPSRNHSTDYIQKAANLTLGMQALYFRNGVQGQAVYLNKTGDGVTYPDISRFTYFGAKFPRFGMMTINDDNVLSNYHKVFIPKAVKYSAGLLDYFFRGTMVVTLNINTNIGTGTDTYTFTNNNTSGEDFFYGSFSVIEEATDGTRTLTLQTNLSDIISGGILSNCMSASITLSDPIPVPSGTKFFVVYQGTIGQSNSAPLDPVDANIGIAAARPSIQETTTNTYYGNLDDFGLEQGSTITTNLVSDDFPFTPTVGNFEVIVNSGIFDDYGSIGNIDSIGVGYPSPIYNSVVDPSQVCIIGNHLSVNLSATDVFGDDIGYQDVSITWRVFLPPQ